LVNRCATPATTFGHENIAEGTSRECSTGSLWPPPYSDDPSPLPRGESNEFGSSPGIHPAASARNIALKARNMDTRPRFLWRQSVTSVEVSRIRAPGAGCKPRRTPPQVNAKLLWKTQFLKSSTPIFSASFVRRYRGILRTSWPPGRRVRPRTILPANPSGV